ncbi:hypothetical protein DD238_006645 [Peronospora effusa]|uniref:Uncharacterized protein n=1 Tax=Peronospora effusa TaxID=542832 RepID=A0A3M6VBN6_9STRA|nr:hypothetical protein DD238_006645 [Peronospora effusa]RQM13889.1 hypothetical protein DD237_005548 [Peronospora effusa]
MDDEQSTVKEEAFVDHIDHIDHTTAPVKGRTQSMGRFSSQRLIVVRERQAQGEAASIPS